ncbi:hypothetical protein N4562_09330 [Ligilactobacillus agilis]|uniref:Uncharacterized protein n=1 Tax=Ligilactobacillus agilis TaxID=1601 RepID=A0A9Q9J8T7_9LACO|nr:hypothetical protein [Ligilactobacillus agilis]UXC63225.1 hypothetical protein N4562_09330 [Ligilactobacillus agilis]UXC65224.1 hypothetical protein N4597_09325 [Ligilactobacillus agilis]
MFKYIGGILLAILILIGGAYYYHVSAQAKEVKKETAFINNAQRTFVNSKTFADKLASYQNIKSRYAYYKANGKNNQEVLSKYQRILAQDQHYFTDKLDKLLKANTFNDDQLSELSKADVKKAKADLKEAKKYLAKISPIYSKNELKAKQAQIDDLLNKLDQPVKKKHHKKKKKAQASSSSSIVSSSSSEEASSSSTDSDETNTTTTSDYSQTTTYQAPSNNNYNNTTTQSYGNYGGGNSTHYSPSGNNTVGADTGTDTGNDSGNGSDTTSQDQTPSADTTQNSDAGSAETVVGE